jgi:hypothetical protein
MGLFTRAVFLLALGEGTACGLLVNTDLRLIFVSVVCGWSVGMGHVGERSGVLLALKGIVFLVILARITWDLIRFEKDRPVSRDSMMSFVRVSWVESVELLLDNGAIEGSIEDLDDVGVSALCEDVDFGEEALEAFAFVNHVLYSHDLDRHLLIALHVDC